MNDIKLLRLFFGRYGDYNKKRKEKEKQKKKNGKGR